MSDLLSVGDLRVAYGDVVAVDGVSFDLGRGDVLAVVGESGSGKSTLGLGLLRLLPPSATVTGTVQWKGRDLLTLDPAELRLVRGGEIAMVFQDPLSALNPVHTVGRQVAEVVRVHEGTSRAVATRRALDALRLVGIPRAEERLGAYPHELSGGMRQRVLIAMAIVCNPDLLIADEPTTALDVTVQAQVLDLLLSVKDEIDSSILLISHDLGVVAGAADRVMVLYAGRQAELGTTDEVLTRPRHPYTLGLLASLPRVDDDGTGRLVPIDGAPPSPADRPSGCPFHPRCPLARVPGLCDEVVPPLREVGADHLSACHFAEDLGGLAAHVVAGRPT